MTDQEKKHRELRKARQKRDALHALAELRYASRWHSLTGKQEAKMAYKNAFHTLRSVLSRMEPTNRNEWFKRFEVDDLEFYLAHKRDVILTDSIRGERLMTMWTDTPGPNTVEKDGEVKRVYTDPGSF